LKDGRVLYDYFHLNTITILPENPLGERDTRFRAGNLLVCFRNVNQIAVLDKETKRILWVWGEGVLEWPHHPTMVENGNVLVFDNGVRRKSSRVLELDPVTGDVVWEYAADPPESFYTYEKGSAQRLPNGNTLICDGDNGRAFEVTRDGEMVWEWLNPATRKNHRVQLYRMTRLPPETVTALLLR
jgi:outer membrane protein assembly factor BamB